MSMRMCSSKHVHNSALSASITPHIHVHAISQGPLEQTPPSVLAALAHGFEQRDVECSKPTHKIRVDFKVGHL